MSCSAVVSCVDLFQDNYLLHYTFLSFSESDVVLPFTPMLLNDVILGLRFPFLLAFLVHHDGISLSSYICPKPPFSYYSIIVGVFLAQYSVFMTKTFRKIDQSCQLPFIIPLLGEFCPFGSFSMYLSLTSP